MGTLLYLNSQEEQIILDHGSHTDHSQLNPEQAARAVLGGLPGAACQCPLRHGCELPSALGHRRTARAAARWERSPWNHTNTGQSVSRSCSHKLQKMEQKEP